MLVTGERWLIWSMPASTPSKAFKAWARVRLPSYREMSFGGDGSNDVRARYV